MLKLIYCLRRKPGLSVEEFQRYWRDVHAPIVAERAGLIGVTRYIQAHTVMPEVIPVLQQRNGGSPEPYDGVAEIWIETLDALGQRRPSRATGTGRPPCRRRPTSSTWPSHPSGLRKRMS